MKVSFFSFSQLFSWTYDFVDYFWFTSCELWAIFYVLFKPFHCSSFRGSCQKLFPLAQLIINTSHYNWMLHAWSSNICWKMICKNHLRAQTSSKVTCFYCHYLYKSILNYLCDKTQKIIWRVIHFNISNSDTLKKQFLLWNWFHFIFYWTLNSLYRIISSIFFFNQST